jgi:hypothetical protein
VRRVDETQDPRAKAAHGAPVGEEKSNPRKNRTPKDAGCGARSYSEDNPRDVRKNLGGGWVCGWFWCGCAGLICAFAYFEAGETADGDFFAEVGDGLIDFFTDGHGFVFDEVLFVEAGFLVELFHFASDDFLDDLLGLAGGASLGQIDFAFAVEHFRSDVFAAHVARIDSGDVHGDVVAKLLEGIGARDEIAFAIDFDDHADFSASMNIVADEAFGGFARGFLGRGGLTLFAEDVDGLLDVTAGFDQGSTTIAEPRVGEFSEFFYELGWNVHDWLRCTHPFFSFSLNLNLEMLKNFLQGLKRRFEGTLNVGPKGPSPVART